MTEEQFTIHQAGINNHCPNCFAAKSLTFSFFQNQKENSWYIKTQAKVTDQLFCAQCQETIYPSAWDDGIERVFLYHQKLLMPNKAGYQLKKKALWDILIVTLVSIATGVWGWLTYGPQ